MSSHQFQVHSTATKPSLTQQSPFSLGGHAETEKKLKNTHNIQRPQQCNVTGTDWTTIKNIILSE